MLYWGYLHKNGDIMVKTRPFTDETGNPLVKLIVPPFKASSHEDAKKIITEKLTAVMVNY